MKNWKMFGLWICGITIIPCYYDIERYYTNLKFAMKYRRRYINFKIFWYHWRCLFDTKMPKL